MRDKLSAHRTVVYFLRTFPAELVTAEEGSVLGLCQAYRTVGRGRGARRGLINWSLWCCRCEKCCRSVKITINVEHQDGFCGDGFKQTLISCKGSSTFHPTSVMRLRTYIYTGFLGGSGGDAGPMCFKELVLGGNSPYSS